MLHAIIKKSSPGLKLRCSELISGTKVLQFLKKISLTESAGEHGSKGTDHIYRVNISWSEWSRTKIFRAFELSSCQVLLNCHFVGQRKPKLPRCKHGSSNDGWSASQGGPASGSRCQSCSTCRWRWKPHSSCLSSSGGPGRHPPSSPTLESPPSGVLKKSNWELKSKIYGNFKVRGGENILTTSPYNFSHN